MIKIQEAITEDDLKKCAEVLMALRPHLTDVALFEMLPDMQREGYRLLFIEEDGIAVAALGFRYLQFLHQGKHFYIDDLSTLTSYRGKGYGSALLKHVFGLA